MLGFLKLDLATDACPLDRWGRGAPTAGRLGRDGSGRSLLLVFVERNVAWSRAERFITCACVVSRR
jgi:hypothetical protein